MYLSAFINENDELTVHSSQCSHVVRNWRKFGQPIVTNAESQMGMLRQIKALGIRVSSVRVMGCAGLPEGFWSQTPAGTNLKLLSTREGAHRATQRIKREVSEEWKTTIDNMGPMLREMFDLTPQ